MLLTITSHPDIHGCNTETIEPVSMIILITPIFTHTEGVPHSKRTGNVGVATA